MCVVSSAITFEAEEARLVAEIARLHKREARLISALSKQSHSRSDFHDVIGYQAVLLDEGNSVMNSGDVAGSNPSTPPYLDQVQKEQQEAQEEGKEKALINSWDHVHPSKRALGIENANNAASQLAGLEAKAATAEGAYAAIIPNSPNNSLITQLESKRDEARVNASKALNDAFSEVGSWHQVVTSAAGMSSECVSSGCVILPEGKKNVYECQKVCEGSDCNTINFCPPRTFPGRDGASCTNKPAPWMIESGTVCQDSATPDKCKLVEWTIKKYCQQACFDIGAGYQDDNCTDLINGQISAASNSSSTCETQGQCCKQKCSKCTTASCSLVSDKSGWDVMTTLPGDAIAKRQKLKYLASEARMKYQIALANRQIAESRYQKAQAGLKKDEVFAAVAKAKSLYTSQATRAATAIGSAQAGALAALEKIKAQAVANVTNEEAVLTKDRERYDSLDKAVHQAPPGPCQRLDFLHRHMVKNIVRAVGFPEAEARCAALKSSEEKACQGKPESEWSKNVNRLRAEEATLEVQTIKVGEVKGVEEGYDAAVKNATDSISASTPILGKLELRVPVDAQNKQNAEQAISVANSLIKLEQSKAEAANETAQAKKSVYATADAAESASEGPAIKAENELSVKLQERVDKAEIKTKLAGAVKEHQEQVQNLRFVYNEARDNATAATATALNLADLAAASRSAYMSDNTSAKLIDKQTAEFEADHGHTMSVAAKALEARAKETLDTGIAQAPSGIDATLDSATELDSAAEFDYASHTHDLSSANDKLSSFNKILESDEMDELTNDNMASLW